MDDDHDIALCVPEKVKVTAGIVQVEGERPTYAVMLHVVIDGVEMGFCLAPDLAGDLAQEMLTASGSYRARTSSITRLGDG